MRPRRGFIYVNTLVTVSLFLLIASATLPAVLAARERARMTACANNLKQVGLAMMNYMSMHRVLPPGTISWNLGRGKNEKPGANLCRMSILANEDCSDDGLGRYSMASAFTLLLPFMEQRTAYDQYNFDKAGCSAANATAVSHGLTTFLCPSNPRGTAMLPVGTSTSFYQGAGEIKGVAPTDYVLCAGASALQLALCQSPTMSKKSDPKNAVRTAAWMTRGAFGINSSVRPEIVRDGMSNTILAGEAVGGKQVKVGVGANDSLFPKSAEDILVPSPLGTRALDTPWSKGFFSGDKEGNGGFSSILAVTAFDAWYNVGEPVPEADKQPAIGELGLVYAIAVDSPDSVVQLGFTPIPLNVNKSTVAHPTIVNRNDDLALGKTLDAAIEGDKPKLADLGFAGSAGGFRGYHAEGINFVFADGHISRLLPTIDPRVLVGLSTIAGSEVGPAP